MVQLCRLKMQAPEAEKHECGTWGQGVHLKCCATNLIQFSAGYSLNERLGTDRIPPSKFCTPARFGNQRQCLETLILSMKLAAPVCGRILAALVIASALVASCGGGGGGGSAQSGPAPISNTSAGSASGTPAPPPTPTSPANALAIVVDAGPAQLQAQGSIINIAYVTVTVCTPGSTTSCQTIDHVQLDTGSSGLRLLKSELYSSLNLPQVTSAAGAIGECAAFVVGTTWGSVRSADIYLNGEVARNVPFQDIGDTPGGYSAVPTDCASYGTMQDTQAQLGSNGLLGIGLFQNDCDVCQLQVIPGTYYTCNTGGCTDSTVTATQTVQNPVADFAQDNNGTQIYLQPIGSSGYTTGSVSGTLFFGIGTQTNNSLPTSATVYATDSNGYIITQFNTTTMTASYIDSGSNGLFFNDTNITQCSNTSPWYCPQTSPLNLTATNAGVNGSSGSVQLQFSIVSLTALSTGDVAANIGGPGTNNSFDWGLPFFYGRSVFTGIQGTTPPAGVPPGPYFAY